uniref:Uncharacterized protein n=1 Tax=Panagrolaimus sp. ES5 TaxID=591445 RepID=A0AC34GQT8_9BILA
MMFGKGAYQSVIQEPDLEMQEIGRIGETEELVIEKTFQRSKILKRQFQQKYYMKCVILSTLAIFSILSVTIWMLIQFLSPTLFIVDIATNGQHKKEPHTGGAKQKRAPNLNLCVNFNTLYGVINAKPNKGKPILGRIKRIPNGKVFDYEVCNYADGYVYAMKPVWVTSCRAETATELKHMFIVPHCNRRSPTTSTTARPPAQQQQPKQQPQQQTPQQPQTSSSDRKRVGGSGGILGQPKNPIPTTGKKQSLSGEDIITWRDFEISSLAELKRTYPSNIIESKESQFRLKLARKLHESGNERDD